MIIDQQNKGIHFLMTHVLQLQFLYCFKWSRNQILFWTSSLIFFSRYFCLSTQFISFLTLEPSAIYQLTFFRIFSCVLSCTKKYFLMCSRNESDLDHTLSWKLILKYWLKNFWEFVQKKQQEWKKFKKSRMAIAKLLTFNSNEMLKTNQYKKQPSLAKVMLWCNERFYLEHKHHCSD